MFSVRSRGFTLIELLVVIAIIGLLASVVLASLNSAREKGRNARRAADMKQVQLALELYYDKFGVYPTRDASPYPIPIALVNEGFLPSQPHDPLYGVGTNNYRYYEYTTGCSGGASSCYILLVRNFTDQIPGVSTSWCDTGIRNSASYDDCPF